MSAFTQVAVQGNAVNFHSTPCFIGCDVDNRRVDRPSGADNGILIEQELLDRCKGSGEPASVPLVFFLSWKMRMCEETPSW